MLRQFHQADQEAREFYYVELQKAKQERMLAYADPSGPLAEKLSEKVDKWKSQLDILL